MFNKRLFNYFLQVILLCSSATGNGNQSIQVLERCSTPYPPHRCGFSILNETQLSATHHVYCSADYMQGSFYRPPVIPGHSDIYRMIECEAPVEHFHNMEVSEIDCPNNMGHNSCVKKRTPIPCTLMNGYGKCWHIYIYVKVSFEIGNSSVIPLFGISNSSHNQEYYCIYIRPSEPAVMTTSTDNPGPSPSTCTSIAESTVYSSVMLSTKKTSTITSLRSSTPVYDITPTSSSISSGGEMTPSSSSMVIQSPRKEETVPPAVGVIGPTSSTAKGLTTVLVLGAALAGVFIALVISCILNVLVYTRKQAALSQVPGKLLKAAGTQADERPHMKAKDPTDTVVENVLAFENPHQETDGETLSTPEDSL